MQNMYCGFCESRQSIKKLEYITWSNKMICDECIERLAYYGSKESMIKVKDYWKNIIERPFAVKGTETSRIINVEFLAKNLKKIYSDKKAGNHGKFVGGYGYFAFDSLDYRDWLTWAVWFLIDWHSKDVEQYNVVKLHSSGTKLSLCHYENFEDELHPALTSSINFEFKYLRYSYKCREYRNNRPILHRKELLYKYGTPYFNKMKLITEREEAAGLYEDTKRIGRENYWNQLLKDKNFKYNWKCRNCDKEELIIDDDLCTYCINQFNRCGQCGQYVCSTEISNKMYAMVCTTCEYMA